MDWGFFASTAIAGLLAGLMYSLVAIGFVLIYKTSGVLNFAQGAMVLFAALTFVSLHEMGIPFWLAFLATLAGMVVLGILIEALVLRPLVNQPPITLFMATLGLSYVIEGAAQLIWGTQVHSLDLGIDDSPLPIPNILVSQFDLFCAMVAGGIVAVVALVGVFTNGISALVLARHRHDDLNARGAFLHLASDAAISVAVIVSGILVRATGYPVIDTAMSLALAIFILVSTFKLLAESLRLVLQGVPESIDCSAVERFLLSQPGVKAAHDLHIWAMSTAENAMTAHLVMPSGHPGDEFLADLASTLNANFKLGHVTLQVETGNACRACQLRVVSA